MSVVDQLKKLFSKKRPAESEADLSLGMPDGSMDPMATGAMEAPGTMAMAPVEERVDEAPASRMAAEDEMMVPPVDESELVSVPLLGRRTIVQHQRILFILLAFALVVLGAVTVFALNQADRVAQQVAGTGQSLMQSQRLAKSVSQALVGSAQAFPDVKESADVLAKTVRGLASGDDQLRLQPVATELQEDVTKITPLMERAEKNAGTVMGQQKILTQVGNALRTINRQSSDLLEIAETVSSLKLQQNAPPAEISAAGQLVMLTQRIGKSANEFLTMEGVSPEAVFLLGKDLNSFKEIAQGLLDGSPELRLAGSKDEQTRERLDALMKLYEQTRSQAGAILGNLQGLVSAREAQAAIIADSEPLRRALEDLQGKLSAQTGLGAGALAALAISAVFAILCAVGLAYVQLQDSRKRQVVAEQQRLEAEGQEQEAQARQRRQPGGHFAADERIADGGRRRSDAAGHGDRGHHRRHRRLGELHGGGVAPAGHQRAVHGVARWPRPPPRWMHVDRAAGRVQRADERDPGHRQVGARDGRPHQPGVQPGAGIGPGGAPVAGGRRVRPAGGAERDRRHERDPRPDPGNLQAHQAAGRVLAGDR
jgi:twitching motility protein PilJ